MRGNGGGVIGLLLLWLHLLFNCEGFYSFLGVSFHHHYGKIDMKKYHGLCATVVGFLVAFLLIADGMAEPVKSKGKGAEQGGQEFLHFGNMGGMLPTLEPSDLKAADSEGAQLVLKFCSQCHNAPGPGMHTVEEWNQVFWKMIWRMQIMKPQFASFMVPTYAQSHVMYSYLSGNALQAISSGDIVTTTDGAMEFVRICSQCHRLPSPTIHEAKDWRDVVHRMQRHMKSMGRVYPSSEVVDRIVAFLKLRGVKPTE